MFDLRKRFEKLDLSPAAALTKAKTVSVAPARTVSMQQAKPVAIQQPKANYSAINQGLNSGRSWEDISRQTGTDLNTVKSYSQQTRPNYGISGPKVQSAPKLTMTQPRQTLSIAQPKQPTMQMSQPKLKTPSMSMGTVQTPKLTMAPQAMTPERTRQNKMYQGFKQGLSFEDIARNSGNSMQEIQKYKDTMFPTYGDKGAIGNIANGIGDLAKGMWNGGKGLVTRPFTDATDLNRQKGEAELQQINKDFQSGAISPDAAMERASTLAGKYTTQKAYQDKNGWIRVGNQNVGEFAGNIAQQGLDTSNLLPVAGGVLSGAAKVAQMGGKTVLANTLGKGAGLLTGGTTSLATSKLAQNLASRGMNSETARIVGNAITSNAKQAAMYGTLQTGSDVLNGRGVSPESLAANYGGTFAMGVLPDIGIPMAARGIKTGVDAIPTAHKTAIAHPLVQEAAMVAKDKIARRQALLDSGVSPNNPQVVYLTKGITADAAEYDRVYKQVFEQSKAQLEAPFVKVNDFTKKHLIPGGTLDAPLNTKKAMSIDPTDPTAALKAEVEAPKTEGLAPTTGQEIYTNYNGKKGKVVGERDGYILVKPDNSSVRTDMYTKEQFDRIISRQDDFKLDAQKTVERQASIDRAEKAQADATKAVKDRRESMLDYTGMTPMQKGRLDKMLNKKVNVWDKAGTLDEVIQAHNPTEKVKYRNGAYGVVIPDDNSKVFEVPKTVWDRLKLDEVSINAYGEKTVLRKIQKNSPSVDTNLPKAVSSNSIPQTRENSIIPRVGDTALPIDRNLVIGDTAPLKKGYSRPDILTTVSGRKIQLDQYNPKGRDPSAKWNDTLIDAAIEEAKLRNDSMNLGIFEDMKGANYKNISQSDLSGIHQYLFGSPDFIKLTYNQSQPTPQPKPEAPKQPTPFEKSLEQAGIVPKKTEVAAPFEKNLEKAGLAPSRGTVNKPVGKRQAVPQPTQVLKTTQIQQPSVTSVAKTSKTSQLAKAQEQKLTSTAQPLKESQVSTSSRSYADNTTNEIKKRGFTQSVKGSDEVSSQVRRKVSGEYNVRSTNKLALNADDYVKGDIGVVSKDVNSRLDTPLGKVTDQDIADSIAVAKRLDSMGKFNESQAIYDKLAEHGTKGGQAIQAFSLLQNRTPEGVKFQMLKHLKKAGVKLSDADQKTVGKLIDEVRKTKVGTEARDRALFKTLDYVSRKIPTNSSDKLVNIWRAGLLTAPKTTGGNLLGNTTELATQKLWANPVAVATDKFFSMFTGKRTKTIGSGTVKGMADGVVKGADYMKTGFDPRNAGNMKYDAPRRVNYKNKVLDTYVNGVYRWMGAQDQPFYYGAKTAAAYDLAKADGINLGYKGQQLAEYVEKSVADGAWKPQTFKTAKDVTDYAKYAVYQNETMLGSMASGLKQGAGRYSKAGRAITDFILPFTQVPSSVAMRIIDRTPVGIVKEAVSQIKKGSFDQRAMAEAIGNGSFGIPVIAAGFALANSGELTGQYPTDQKEQKLWEAEGKQPYSVKIDGKWHSLNYMQPFGTLMAIGKQVSDDKADGKSDAEAWMNATGAAAKSIESQSFLQGLNGVLSAINDPKRSMNQYAKSTASSVIPNFIRSGAVASDDKQRETKTPFDAFKGAIPGVRQTLPTKLDMFGKELEARDDFVNQYMNPFKPSRVRNANDATTQELRRLQDAKNGIVTTEFTKSAIAGAELNDAQIRNLNELVNTEVKSRWDKAVQTSDYKSLSDEDKADYLKKIKDGVADRVKAQFVKDNMINTTGKYGKKSIPNSPTSTNGNSDKPDTGWTDEYNAAKSAYDKESKNWTEIQRVGKEKELKTLGVKKNFSKDATRLYDMAEKDIYAYLDKSDDKKASDYLSQVVAYGDKMVEAGLWTTNKLRDKNGNVQYKRGYTGSTGGSRTTSRSSSAKTGSSSSSTKKGKFDYKLNMFSDSTRSSGSAADLYALLRKATMKG